MAGLTIGDIRAGLKTCLDRAFQRETNIAEYGQDMTTPVISIILENVPTYTETYGGIGSIPFVLSIDPGGTDESSVKRLDDYLSAGAGNRSSVIDALMADKTLGGTASGIEVTPRLYNAELVVAELLVVVRVKKIRTTT